MFYNLTHYLRCKWAFPKQAMDDKELLQADESVDEKAAIRALAYTRLYGSSEDFKLDENGGVAGVKSFEDLLEIIGTFGKWNITIFLACSMNTFVGPMQAITYQFLGAIPDYWCYVDTLVDANWTQQQIIDLAIPSKNGIVLEGCKMYNYNYSSAVEMGYEEAMKHRESIALGDPTTLISCYSRDFNTTEYKSTLVTEWDLVCERRALYSTTQAATQIGILFGALIFGFLTDKYGRRPIALICVVLSLITGFGAAISPVFSVYVIFKTLVSCFNYGIHIGCFVHLMELCSASQRSSIGSIFVLPWCFGYMVVPIIAYVIRSWRWLQATYSSIGLMLFSLFWLLPESPRWLISEGRYEEAVKILSEAAKVNGRTLPPSRALIISMKRMSPPEAKSPKQNITDRIVSHFKLFLILLLKSEFRQKILICFFCWFSVSMVYYGVSLNSENLSTNTYLYVFLGGLVEVPSSLILWPMLAYLGRKVSLISLYLMCAFSIAIIAILLATEEEVSTGMIMFLSLSGKFAITAAFHLLYVFTVEIFPTKYRSLALGESSVMARGGSIASPYINDLLGDAISWVPSALFAAVSVLSAGLSLALPETKGTDLTEENATERNGTLLKTEIQMKQAKVNGAFELNTKGLISS